jgi:hypothetical protein
VLIGDFPRWQDHDAFQAAFVFLQVDLKAGAGITLRASYSGVGVFLLFLPRFLITRKRYTPPTMETHADSNSILLVSVKQNISNEIRKGGKG